MGPVAGEVRTIIRMEAPLRGPGPAVRVYRGHLPPVVGEVRKAGLGTDPEQGHRELVPLVDNVREAAVPGDPDRVGHRVAVRVHCLVPGQDQLGVRVGVRGAGDTRVKDRDVVPGLVCTPPTASSPDLGVRALREVVHLVLAGRVELLPASAGRTHVTPTGSRPGSWSTADVEKAVWPSPRRSVLGLYSTQAELTALLLYTSAQSSAWSCSGQGDRRGQCPIRAQGGVLDPHAEPEASRLPPSPAPSENVRPGSYRRRPAADAAPPCPRSRWRSR
jgi:hypothetical protein